MRQVPPTEYKVRSISGLLQGNPIRRILAADSVPSSKACT
ncbi:Uncharacterised protein [Vibrio cholerae]|nr:Uncharacterised protein [Vibrio cholerae]CSI71903.1 Uncharacterised protein [Vibrio cholerae]